jgi:uncharacterized membrane protein
VAARKAGAAARKAGAAAPPGGGQPKGKNKGTTGGRPQPQPAAASRRAGNAQARPANGQRAPRHAPPPGRPPRTPAPAAAPGTDPAAPPQAGVPLWLQLSTWVLALAGLGVSIYLTIAHYNTSVSLVCPATGGINCEKVTTSPESVVFGIFPVAVLGLAFYVFLAAITSPWAWRAPWPVVRWARAGSVIVGMGFVLYLLYAELFSIGAICLWCTSVHVITFVIFALVMFSAAAGYGVIKPAPRR